MDFLINNLVNRIIDATADTPQLAATPIQQKSNHIPHLFVDQLEERKTQEWLDLLSSSRSNYDHCQVVSLTHGKALASPLSHEFIQFIVEDTHNGVRTRVFTDRQKQSPPDRVIVGNNWASDKNLSDQKDLPMPLKSLTFQGKRPPVIALAEVLAAVTRRAPEYKYTSTMCWWYAGSVFETARARFGGEIREWQFASWASQMVVWDYIVVPKVDMETEARQFKKQNIEGMSYQTPTAGFKKEITTESYLKNVANMMNSEQTQKEYEEALAIDSSEKFDLRLAVQEIKNNARDSSAKSKDVQDASVDFSAAVLNEADKDQNLAAFEAAWQKNARRDEGISEDDTTLIMRQKPMYFGPGEKQKAEFDEAMEAFVGGVLRMLDEDEKNSILKDD